MLSGKQRSQFPVWVNRESAEKARLRERWRHFSCPPREESSRAASRINLGLPLWTPLLDWHDASWTGCALEIRHPLIDVRVVILSLGLPAVPWCVGKELLRRCLRGLPQEIRSRPKAPLQGDPVIASLRKAGRIAFGFLPAERELHRYVETVSSLLAESGHREDDVWSALKPVSFNCWLRSKGRDGQEAKRW